jgi:tetrahydromethanopterin S-methyltransferase subunit G
MKTYPISVSWDTYGGRDERKLRNRAEYNRVAKRVETYLNAKLAAEPEGIHQYLSHSIARDLGEDYNLVQRIVFSIDCGHNGVTIVKGDYHEQISRLRQPLD